MPVTGGSSENPDKTKNYSITAFDQDGDVTVSAGAFVEKYNIVPDKFLPKPQYSSAGVNVGVAHAAGHSASITAQHSPSYGNQLTAATNVNILEADNHRVDLNTFTSRVAPKGPMEAFNTHGGGIEYQCGNNGRSFTAATSISRTPYFNETNYSLNTGLNIHQTPTSSFSFGLGANRTDNRFGKGDFEPRINFGFKRTF